MLLTFANGVTLEVVQEDGRFLGIGHVTCDGLDLRSAELPWTIYAESENGVRFEDWVLTTIETTERGEKTIVAKARGRWMPRLQQADAMGDARVLTRSTKSSEAELRWTFRPIAETIDRSSWSGLAMTVSMSCPGNPIHWLIEDGTWEIGAAATGCTLIQQDVSTIDLEQVVKRDSRFSTIERFATEAGWGGAYPMDMLPRCAGSSPLDFQCKGDTALILFSERPSLTRCRIEKQADEDCIHYTDRPFFALAEKVTAPERKLLIHRRGRDFKRHEQRNLWLSAFQEVRARIHATYGFTLEIPRPTVWAHLWDNDLRKYGAAWGDQLIANMPTYAQLGYHHVFTHGVWESVTSDPLRRPEEGNICCPYSFQFAEQFGGNAGMRKLIDAGKAEGIEVMQWFSFHLSEYAPIWKDHPEWLLQEANGDPWDAAYQTLRAGRMRSDFGEWMKNGILEVRNQTGLPSIFFDSYQNLGVTGVHGGAPDKATQAEEIWAMQGELQRAGFTVQRPEIITIFGVSNVALFGFANDRFRRRLWDDAVQGDHAFALIDTAPAFFTNGTPFTAEGCSPERYFWLAAHRCLPSISADPWKGELPGGDLAEAYAKVNRLYEAALPAMQRPELVAGGGQVLWRDTEGNLTAVWAIADGTVSYQGPARNLSVATGEDVVDTLTCRAGQVWVLGSFAAAKSALQVAKSQR